MKRHVDALVREALSDAIEGGLLRTSGVPRFTVDAPRHAAFGDLACDVALVLGRQLGRSPHAIGATIASRLRDPHGWLAEVGVGGPGFVNFRFAPPFWHAALVDALEAGGAYGRSDAAVGRRVRVELACATPSGATEARGAAVADAVAGLLREAGAGVERVGAVPGLAPAAGREGRFGELIGVVVGDCSHAKRRLEEARAALDATAAPLRIVPVHEVRVTRDGSPERQQVTAGALLNEIGPDAFRFLLLLERADRTVDLDLELAKCERTDNPLFLVQYAHARAASRAVLSAGRGDRIPAQGDLSLLGAEDVDLLRMIASWPDVIEAAARTLEPDRIARFAVELALATHRWCNRQGPDWASSPQARARCALAGCLEMLLRRALAVGNVSAPERM